MKLQLDTLENETYTLDRNTEACESILANNAVTLSHLEILLDNLTDQYNRLKQNRKRVNVAELLSNVSKNGLNLNTLTAPKKFSVNGGLENSRTFKTFEQLPHSFNTRQVGK